MRRGGFGDLADETNARAKKSLALYLNPPVDRSIALSPPESNGQRRQNVVLTRCVNPDCREWPLAGTRAAGKCLYCGTPIGAATPR